MQDKFGLSTDAHWNSDSMIVPSHIQSNENYNLCKGFDTSIQMWYLKKVRLFSLFTLQGTSKGTMFLVMNKGSYRTFSLLQLNFFCEAKFSVFASFDFCFELHKGEMYISFCSEALSAVQSMCVLTNKRTFLCSHVLDNDTVPK